MKKFKCIVCGYIHTGETPPEKCPICGAPKEKFILIEDESTNENKHNDTEFSCDLIVVGSGAAALSAACFAKAKGLEVIVVEKASEFGGTTKRSGGRYWIPNNVYQHNAGISDNKASCLKYMIRLSYPELYDDTKEYYGLANDLYTHFETYYDYAHVAVEKLAELKIMDSELDYCWKKIPYGDYQEHLQEPIIRGRTLYPKTAKGPLSMGNDLVELLLNYLTSNQVKMFNNYQVVDLIMDQAKVTGLKVKHQDSYLNIKAKHGVFFGSGGFSHNLKMMNAFQPGKNYGGCAVPSNEGDLINIALKNNLKIANMQNAYRAQSILEAYLANPGGSSSMFYHIGDSTLQVNKDGKRFMNEKRNYNDRTLNHFNWDANNANWPNLLSFMIFDSRTANLWQGFPPLPVGDPKDTFFIISGNTLDELSDNIQLKLDSLNDKIPNYKLAEDFKENLKQTIETFNDYAMSGQDLEFNRGAYNYDQEYTTFPPTIPVENWPDEIYPNITMHPLDYQGPYYAIILAAGTLDTNGGVVINNKAQVVNIENEVIENLYAGGNCVAAFNKAAYYGAGGTIGPALTTAYLAIENINKNK